MNRSCFAVTPLSLSLNNLPKAPYYCRIYSQNMPYLCFKAYDSSRVYTIPKHTAKSVSMNEI